ncbi:MAG: hypothetical protein HKN48_03845 [Flavobacteriaceae bacterium]|nr:hypothetical protein [Flavobacteriaceae bacterium]
MKKISAILLLLMPLVSICQELTGNELLDKSIAFHDPQGNWASFSGTLKVTMDTPKASPRVSTIKIDLPEEYFELTARRDTNSTKYTIHKGDCTITFNEESNISEEILKENNLSCERAHLYKNYYTYLYGLPMKLKDPGTQIASNVAHRKFKGKEYLVLRVAYDEEVGSDTWFFYFDPTTYAMEIYQFFKGDPFGMGKDTGEYILLSEMETINEIKMPKIRAWYYNKDDKYLGTDSLIRQ